MVFGAWRVMQPPNTIFVLRPNPDKPELNIDPPAAERLKICGPPKADRSVIFLIGLYKIDPPQADLKYSIFNRKYSII
jgi:hypothetical protein